MITMLPKLYKKTSTGAIQYWETYVAENSDHSVGYDIWTKYGQVGGKEQTSVDLISKGKNEGRANETSVQQQAVAEANATWTKKKKSGYVENIESAQADETDEIIEGGIVPMLAKKFADQAHKIKYPAFVQPKLDGIRCIAIIKDGKCTLWSRTRKPITSCPHIVQELEETFGDAVLDGELYNHDFKKDFEKIVSAVRKETPEEGYLNVQYHIYDKVNKVPFFMREKFLSGMAKSMPVVTIPTYVKFVKTESVAGEDEVFDKFQEYLLEGFEGCMVRQSDGLYVNKRSSDLLKVKEMDDTEFKIVDVKEGRGKLAGHAIFICYMPSIDDTFDAKLKGDTEYLKKLWEDPSLWKEKLLTVQHQGYTAYGKPRFPVGLRIRDDL